MKSLIKIISVLFLLLNGISAFYGSWHLISDPSGTSLQMPLTFLQHSPFSDYLLPGIILLIFNGILSFVVIALVLFNAKIYPLAIIAEGCILFGWISIQVIMLRTVAALHIALWTVATFLMLFGVLSYKLAQTKSL